MSPDVVGDSRVLATGEPQLADRVPLSRAARFYGVWARHARLLRVAGVMLILAFAFWAGMAPHFSYRYPLHVDEWIALGFAESTMEQGAFVYPSPFNSTGGVKFHPELGMHLLLGFLKTATGLDWLDLYRVAPGVVMALLAFLTYALGRRDGYGWAAALFVPLIPTSIRTLGPTMVVPVSVAALFIPVTLLVVHRLESINMGASLWLLLLIIGGTIFVHPTTEGVVTALAVLYLVALLLEALAVRRFRAAASLVVAVGVRLLVPAIVLGLWLPKLSQRVAEQSLSRVAPQTLLSLGFNHGFFEAFGGPLVALFVVGVFLFASYTHYGLRSYIVPAFSGVLLFFLLFLHPRYFYGPSFLYERAWMYLGFFMALLAGYAVATYLRSVPMIARKVAAFMPSQTGGWLSMLLLAVGVAAVASAMVTSMTSSERARYANYYHLLPPGSPPPVPTTIPYVTHDRGWSFRLSNQVPGLES